MTTLAKAFIELASYLKNAGFDDPDEEQAAEELVQWCLVEATPEERDALIKVAHERAREEEANGSDPKSIEFYERFAARAQSQQQDK
ncbi:MAG: hypothetical protein ACK4UN_11475 [Limisphaerales bacterium]